MSSYETSVSVQSETTWHELECGLDCIMFEPTWGIDIPSLMKLYTIVHDHCTSREATVAAPRSLGSRGAHLLGEDLYRSLVLYLQQYLLKLKQRLKSFSRQIILGRYLEESVHYNKAAQIINYIFRYLNRHWIKRELDEGRRGIYDVYTLHLVLWHENLFVDMHEELTDALSDLVDKYRMDENTEADGNKRVQRLMEAIVLLQPDGAEIPDSIRDFYGNLLETPWRIAIEACDPHESPIFLYPRPITASMTRRGQTCTNLEEQLVSLTLHSTYEQPLQYSSRDSGTVKLATKDEIIEVDQRAAECSLILKRLCVYFGPEIIAREPIPISNVPGPVLHKVFEWCKHQSDVNTQSFSSVSSEYRAQLVEANDWDQEYFKVDQEMLFEIILAANYLDIDSLLNSGCKTVAQMIKGKSPDEIRSMFNVTNDFTSEEEDQMRRENEWASDYERSISM